MADMNPFDPKKFSAMLEKHADYLSYGLKPSKGIDIFVDPMLTAESIIDKQFKEAVWKYKDGLPIQVADTVNKKNKDSFMNAQLGNAWKSGYQDPPSPFIEREAVPGMDSSRYQIHNDRFAYEKKLSSTAISTFEDSNNAGHGMIAIFSTQDMDIADQHSLFQLFFLLRHAAKVKRKCSRMVLRHWTMMQASRYTGDLSCGGCGIMNTISNAKLLSYCHACGFQHIGLTQHERKEAPTPPPPSVGRKIVVVK